jgi:guanylate kinase
MKRSPRIILLTGPSGAGKSTIAKRLLADPTLALQKFVTCTTRPKREGEEEGKDYWFMTRDEFETRLADEVFFEHAEVYGNYYGSSKEVMNELLQGDKNLLIVIDVQGFKTVQKLYPNTYVIFLDAPKASLIHRLEDRGTDPDDLKRRTDQIDEEELDRQLADVVVQNEDGQIDKTFEQVREIILNLS